MLGTVAGIDEHTPPPSSKRPLVIAANRLPVTRTPNGDWETSPGGLVRALLPIVQESKGAWVGWTGQTDGSSDVIHADGIEMHPVPISADELNRYYEGFSNDTLWPLYHDAIKESNYDSADWDSYVTVNDRFAERMAEVAPPNATVWIHDYHLQLTPAMLRARRSDLRIGWFNHIPFPPLELFQRLPWRTEIIAGLLGADVLGFQRERGAPELHRGSTPARRRDRGRRRARELRWPQRAGQQLPDLDRRRRLRAAGAVAAPHASAPPRSAPGSVIPR